MTLHRRSTDPSDLVSLPPLEQFETWLDKWAPRLLPGWDLGVRFVRVEELDSKRSTAEFCGSFEHFTGEVQICNEHLRSDYILPELMDWEEILVHELLHGVLDFPCLEVLDYGNRFQKQTYERSINVLARALITADRTSPAVQSAS